MMLSFLSKSSSRVVKNSKHVFSMTEAKLATQKVRVGCGSSQLKGKLPVHTSVRTIMMGATGDSSCNPLQIFDAIDTKRKGFFDREEFVIAILNQLTYSEMTHVHNAAKLANLIFGASSSTSTATSSSCSSDPIEIFNAIDADKNGLVDKEEFVHALNQLEHDTSDHVMPHKVQDDKNVSTPRDWEQGDDVEEDEEFLIQLCI